MDRADLDELERRPVRYWNVDGLAELVLGVAWMVWGGAWLVGQTLPHDWRWTTYWLIVPPALALSTAAIKPVTRRLKERLTFPRTGYVEWNTPGQSSRWSTAVAILVSAIALAAVLLSMKRASLLEQRLPPIMGVVLSLSFVALSVRQRAPHLLALAAAGVAVTLAITSLVSGWDALSWMFVMLGAACVLVGVTRLALFVRAHPLAPPEGRP